MTPAKQQHIIRQLREQLLQWEGYKPPLSGQHSLAGLGPLEAAFPNGVFPLGTVHEMVCASSEQAAAAGGLVSGILAGLMKQGGISIWIGRKSRLFAPALAGFGLAPEKIICIDLAKDRDALWVMEEALKCPGLVAVICELRDMDFKQSQRFQRAVEHSRVTGFVLRNAGSKPAASACAARWQVSPLPTAALGGLPGLGYLRWQVDLLKVRNGRTGSWQLEWNAGKFMTIEQTAPQEERQVG